MVDRNGSCRSCGAGCRTVLDLGEQPVLNRYPAGADDELVTYRLTLAVCEACGLAQQGSPPAAADVLRSGTGTYREPTQHLERVAAAVRELVALPSPSAVVGLSEHDVPLVVALRGTDTDRPTLRIDLVAGDLHPPTALLQERVTPDAAPRLLEGGRPAGVLVARSLLEHAHDLPRLLETLAALVVDGGHLVVEVPDGARLLDTADPSLLWEEHVFYFTASSLRATLARHGFEPLTTIAIDEVGELICIARRAAASEAVGAPPAAEIAAAHALADRVADLGARWRALLAAHRAAGRRIALFGAGHTGAMFVNALGLGDAFDAVIDDSPAKQGRLLPGAGLPIVPSSELATIEMCVLAVSGELEGAIVAAHSDLSARGGVFASIAPSSPRYGLADPVRIEPLPIVVVEDDDMRQVGELARRTTRGRARICAHGDPGDALHEMLIVLDRSTYIRPHRHHGRPESFHVVSGEADIVLFDDDGEISGVMEMGPFGSGRAFYYRMNEPRFHMVLVRSEQFVVHETTTGPFDPSGTEQAPWAPSEDDLDARRDYLAAVRARVGSR